MSKNNPFAIQGVRFSSLTYHGFEEIQKRLNWDKVAQFEIQYKAGFKIKLVFIFC